MNMSGVTVRGATDKDYDGVMKIIPNLYNGGDYMPALYHTMLKDPKRFLLVAEINGVIIGFEMHFIVDDDEVFVAEAGRIKEEYRGKGISKLMLQYALSRIYERYPRVKAITFTTENEQEMFKLQYNPSLEMLFYRHAVRIRTEDKNSVNTATSSAKFHDMYDRLPCHQTKVLTPSEAVQTLDNLVNNKGILNEPAWVIHYESFQPMHSNHVTMIHNNTKGISVVLETRDEHNDVTAVSFGSVAPATNGVVFHVDFYCHNTMQDEENEYTLLSVHLLKHLILFNQMKGDYLAVDLVVFLPRQVNTEAVVECLLQAGMTGYEVTEKKRRVYCTRIGLAKYTNSKM